MAFQDLPISDRVNMAPRWSPASLSLQRQNSKNPSDGSILAVGAPSGTGSVVVFQNQGGSWIQLGDDITRDDVFFGNGLGLSADGLRVAIGADGSAGATGSLRVFDFVGANWTQVGETIVGEAGDRIGSSIDISDDGSIVAVSAIGNEDMGGGSGAARVYRDTGGSGLK